MKNAKTLRQAIEELAREWEVDAAAARKYSTYPKSAGIDSQGALLRAAYLNIHSEKLRRVLAETEAA